MNKLRKLDNLILEVLKEQGIELQEETLPKGLGSAGEKQKQIAIKLPKFRITEDWGKPGNQDRGIVEKFFNKIEGSTIAERIDTLNKFITECDEDSCIQAQEIPKVLSNLVTLDVLASIIHEFGASPAGFLFEAFLASLVGGTQIVPKASISTEDIIDQDGVPVSIKLIKDDAYVHGSWAELKAAWGINPKKRQTGWGLKLDPKTGKRVSEPEEELDEEAAPDEDIIPSAGVDNMTYLVVNKIKGKNKSVDLKWYKFPVTEKLMSSLMDIEMSGQRNHPQFGFSGDGKKFIIKKLIKLLKNIKHL